MVTLDGGWVKDEQIYNLQKLNNLTGLWEAKSSTTGCILNVDVNYI